MSREQIAYLIAVGIFASLLLLAGSVYAAPLPAALPQATPSGRAATQAELAKAQTEWAQSAHADTYDHGMGANTTCASCKSPRNWDPVGQAIEEAHDCGACKRIPGAPRPELTGGVAVPQSEWHNIGCEICHQPIGDSYSLSIAYWNQASQSYQPLESTTDLCAKCHEGQHGFEVVAEQAASPAHQGWECTRCHGPHGAVSRCSDCHDALTGSAAEEHARHTQVNCTACHDAGDLGIWIDPDPNSRHNGEVISRRFAHTITSWPSHNLQTSVRCQRCHHPLDKYSPILAENISCKDCHPEGAGFFWCIYFERNPNPNTP